MKKYIWVLMTTLMLSSLPTQQSHAVVWVIVKAAIKKVIKAMDLAVQRLQNETIKLQNAQKALENAMSKLKLKEIAEWTEKQRELFATYYDELRKVKALIAYAKEAKTIAERQRVMVLEYQRAMQLLRRDKHFSAQRIRYMEEVYSGMLTESLKNVEQIIMVVNSFATQMSDAKRIELIKLASARLDQTANDLHQFTNENILFSMQQAKDHLEQQQLENYYGIDYQKR